jgi:hypothetical protein
VYKSKRRHATLAAQAIDSISGIESGWNRSILSAEDGVPPPSNDDPSAALSESNQPPRHGNAQMRVILHFLFKAEFPLLSPGGHDDSMQAGRSAGH